MNLTELQYALALQDAKGIGFVNAQKLIKSYGNATQLFDNHQQEKYLPEIGPEKSKKLFNKEALLKAEKEIEKAVSKHLNFLYFLDKNYPKNLINCPDAPLLLYQDGDSKLNNQQRIISIVGTRNITNYGRNFCEELMESLKPYNPLIVSGYAFGVDICAHTEALKNDLSTLGVLAHGYGTLYPKEHKKYYGKVRESGGFLSEFPFDEPPYRENFLKRNRIVAGISQATIIIESAAKGGSLVTADIANSYNRDVFAVPGKTTDVYSRGCNNLIKHHKAAMITSGEDLIEQLGWVKKQGKIKTIQPQLFVDLHGEEKQLFDLLELNSIHMDELARNSGIPIYKVSNLIFQLEMKGLIQVLPGKLIKRAG